MGSRAKMRTKEGGNQKEEVSAGRKLSRGLVAVRQFVVDGFRLLILKRWNLLQPRFDGSKIGE